MAEFQKYDIKCSKTERRVYAIFTHLFIKYSRVLQIRLVAIFEGGCMIKEHERNFPIPGNVWFLDLDVRYTAYFTNLQ